MLGSLALAVKQNVDVTGVREFCMRTAPKLRALSAKNIEKRDAVVAVEAKPPTPQEACKDLLPGRTPENPTCEYELALRRGCGGITKEQIRDLKKLTGKGVQVVTDEFAGKAP